MARDSGPRGLTLIELMFVMALLTVVLAVCLPRLSRFMSGRALVEEANRFIALSRYAKSQSITLGVPMKLWIDPVQGRYGVSPAAGFEDADNRPVEFTVVDGLRLELPQGSADKTGQVSMTYRPDSSVDGDTLQELRIRQGEDDSLRLARNGGQFDVSSGAAQP